MSDGPVYVVRPATTSDAEPLAVVHLRVWQEAYAGLMPPDYLDGLSLAAFTERWQANLAGEVDGTHLRRTVVATANDEPVGFATVGPSRDDGADPAHELYAIYLLAEHRGHGLAARLLAAAATAADAGPALSLWVLRGNQRACAFYGQQGFVPDGQTKPHGPTGTIEERWSRPAPRNG